MFRINQLSIRNFMSIGNVSQLIDFSNKDLVLVLGENLDLGGNDNRNGVGKSSILNALSYALYGSALTNIKKDNLINATNMKNMLVTVSFEVNGTEYKIERGRKPSIFKFSKEGIEQDVDEDSQTNDESQGEGRHTQDEIERIIGISHDMFRHILALNTYVEPFLSLRANDQRIIIEQLLGITKLSERSEKLKEDVRITKDAIKEEEFRISASTEANKRIEQNIISLENKSINWEKTKNKKIKDIESSILELSNVNIEDEISLHKKKKEIEELNAEYKSLVKEYQGIEKEIIEIERIKKRLEKNLLSYSIEICPKCNQAVDAETHKKLHDEDQKEHKEISKRLSEKLSKKEETEAFMKSISSLIPKLPDTYYKTIEEAYNHRSTLENLGSLLSNEFETVNPFVDQIESLKKDGLQVIDFTILNELVRLRDHQEFLLKLLTNKDSFIRKKIIDQNLTFLNHRLSYYISQIGLPHDVKFKSDLEVEIALYGKEFDFDNLSRGERTRLILSLSWAFRDVYESMNDKINLLFIDELLDQGLDSAGVESSLAILKKMGRDSGRNIYMISHRDELIGRVSNILKVVKEGGFTTVKFGDDILND